jgi:hypothetical protein
LSLLNLVEIRAEGRVPPILGHYDGYLQNLLLDPPPKSSKLGVPLF